MDTYDFGLIEIKNKKVKFRFDGFDTDYIIFDLSENIPDKLSLEIPSHIKLLERPCTIAIGNGFSLEFVRQEHGIT